MKKLFFVVFLLLFAQGTFADSMQERVSKIEASWVDNTQIDPQPERKNIFLQLAEDISEVVVAFPSQ
ncbi:MAG: hypothetical protein KAJ63_14970, partial [Methyloprofundus sp.]|nr:hypothetical protein [Methyloprofundus sp.]